MSRPKKSRPTSDANQSRSRRNSLFRQTLSKPWAIPVLLALAALVGAGIWQAQNRFGEVKTSADQNRRVESLTTTQIAPGEAGFKEPGATAKQEPTSAMEEDVPAEGPVEPDPEQAVAWIDQGNRALMDGDAARAVRHYRTALLFNPEDEDIYYNMGIAYSRLGQIDDAIESNRKALMLFPDYAEVHNNLGNLLVRQGKVDEAISHFEEALELIPDYALVHNNLGTARARQGKIPEAIESFSAALNFKPEYLEARFNLANAYLQQEWLKEAEEQFVELLRQHPGFRPAQSALTKIKAERESR